MEYFNISNFPTLSNIESKEEFWVIEFTEKKFPTSCTEVVHICTDYVRLLNVGVLLSRCVCTTSSDNILMIVFAFY